MLLRIPYFVLIVPHWVAEIYAKEFAARECHLVLEVFDGKKYCRRCEVYMYHDRLFCPCCGMQLRVTPSSRKCKEILRKRKAENRVSN